MNWQQIQGKWQEYKGHAKQRWGKLTDSELTVIAGKRDVLASKLMASYGNSKEAVEKQILEFEKSCAASCKETGAPTSSTTAPTDAGGSV